MSLINAGQFHLNQGQQSLGAAAADETTRNIANRNLKEANEQGKASVGSSLGSIAGGIGGKLYRDRPAFAVSPKDQRE